MMAKLPTLEMLAYTVECPRCNAGVGERCVTYMTLIYLSRTVHESE